MAEHPECLPWRVLASHQSPHTFAMLSCRTWVLCCFQLLHLLQKPRQSQAGPHHRHPPPQAAAAAQVGHIDIDDSFTSLKAGCLQ